MSYLALQSKCSSKCDHDKQIMFCSLELIDNICLCCYYPTAKKKKRKKEKSVPARDDDETRVLLCNVVGVLGRKVE